MTKLKVISEAELSTKVTDCVVSVSKKKNCFCCGKRIIYDVDVVNVRRTQPPLWKDLLSVNGMDAKIGLEVGFHTVKLQMAIFETRCVAGV